MLNKRGLGHVEAILSFVIFIGFIVFAFVFFSPFESNRTLRSTSDYAWREVYDFSRVELEIYSVFIDDLSPPLIAAVSLTGAPSGWNAVVEDSMGAIVQSYTDLSGVVHYTTPSNKFARIKFGQDFSQGVNVIAGTPPQSYTVSSSENSKFMSEKKLLELNASYYSDYSNLKKQFNLPNRVNFGFAVTFYDGTQIL